MKLLTNGFTTAASTLCGSSLIGPGQSSVSIYGGQKSLVIDKVVVMVGGTTIAPAGGDGIVGLRYGDSSGEILSTMTICPQPNFVGGAPGGIQQVELSGLGIRTNWFECVTRTTCAGGVGVYVFGE